MIYPNPTTERISVTVSIELLGSIFQIVNHVGQVMIEGKVNSNNEKIDVKSLSTGFYSLRISGNLPQSVSFIKE
jgi:hypothetical protein